MYNMNTKYKHIITSFVLNKVLHHVGMSWIIEANKNLEYYMEEHNSYLITVGPWYNIFICKELHGKVFETFIRNERTEIYNLTYSIDAHEKKNPSEHDNGRSSGGYLIPSNLTTEALVSLSATINFIGFWLQALEQFFLERCNMYIFATKKLFQKTPVELPKPTIPRKKNQSLSHAIGGVWYMKKLSDNIPPLKKRKLTKKSQEKKG